MLKHLLNVLNMENHAKVIVCAYALRKNKGILRIKRKKHH